MTEMKRSFAAQVIDGAVAALKAQWPDIPIYTEFVEQGLQENAFSLRCIDAAVKRSVGARWHARCSLRIYYFPPEDAPWAAMAEALEGLHTALELIHCESGAARGSNMEAHVEDDVAVFAVDYGAFLIRRAEETDMESLDFRIEA